MSTTSTKPYAGYPRVSEVGKRDRDSLQSPKQQKDAILGYAKGARLPVKMYAAELDVSGSKVERAILDSIIVAIERGELAGIIVAKLDRLSRLAPADRIALFDRVERAGGAILSATEPNDTETPEGRWVREIFLGLARMQWERYRDGLELAKRNAIANGIHIGVTAPFGYDKDEDKTSPTYRHLIPNPEESEIVREIYRMRVAGKSTVEIANYLNSIGSRSKAGSAWIHNKVSALIASRVYLGEISYGAKRAKESERYVNAEAHEPLVDLGTWTAAQKPLLRSGRHAPGVTITPWLLKGLVRCQACGYVMLGNRDNTERGRHKKPVYICRKNHSGGICPAPARINAEELEGIALKAFWDIAETAEGEGTPEDAGAERLSELEREVERWRVSMEEWASPETQEALGDVAAWRDGLTKRRSEHERASGELAAYLATVEHTTATTATPVAVLRREWESMSVEVRRDHLSDRLDLLVVTRGGPVAVFRRGSGPAPTALPRNGRPNARLMPIHVPAEAGVTLG